MIYSCCDENRRAAVAEDLTLNGIDYLEVLDLDAPADSPRQKTLMVRLLKPVPAGLTPENVRIEGGDRIRNVGVEWIGIASAPPVVTTIAEKAYFTALDNADHVLLIRTDSSGDHSAYCLSLVKGSGSDQPLADFDPQLSTVEFAFKVECPSDFDCAPRHDCPEDPKPTPDINYLARDYGSIRRVVIDRLSRQIPGWKDRTPADFATTIAEWIAYLGDQQHYELDAITTESYLKTARRRSSLRRHALLVDYAMHEGCNARTWLHLEVSGSGFTVPAGLQLYTRVPGVAARIVPDSPDDRAARRAQALVFEPIDDVVLHQDHNEFNFYTWGDSRCCLSAGATKATLEGHWPELAVGNVLIFQEMKGPLTDEKEDADPSRRHAVRLTSVRPNDGNDPLTDPLPDADGIIHQITEISWHAGDALPFALCISSETDESHGSMLINDVSVARGNILLIDHGRSIKDEELGEVPQAQLYYPPAVGDPCMRALEEPLAPRFRPLLANGQLTYQGTIIKTTFEQGMRRSERMLFDPEASASSAMEWRTADAMADISLESTLGGSVEPWSARRDLLFSNSGDRHFVLETESEGSAKVRFGDDRHGRRPDERTAFTADYRVGNGPSGNAGIDTIVHAVSTEDRIISVTNPLPARTGKSRETREMVRRHAPHAFRTQERAVTPADYAEVTERLEGIQRAAASLRWTGSWHTVFDTVDRVGGAPVDVPFAATTITHLDRYRMAGHDLKITEPVHVSLEIDMLVCVMDEYFRSDVRAGLLELLSNRVLGDGNLGIFHPDRFSFGQTVYLSLLYAAARSILGVASVQITRFQRQGQDDPKPLADGFMELGRLEIPRLDNDPNFPEHGVLHLDLHGGK